MGVPELESSCNALSNLFQGLINDMRDSVPAFEELVNKTTKLHSTLRSSIVAIAAFLEAFQKVADAATGSKGATKEIGKSLTRLCLRHRSIESKLKIYTNSLMEELAIPLQEKLEDWKRNAVQIDKDHAKDNKRVRGDIKRASSDTIRLQKKTRKGKTTYCKGDAREKLETAMLGVTDKYLVLEEVEKSYVRKALTEERKHYCEFICCVRPVVDSEMSMVNEIAHLQEIVDHLSGLAADPDTLPETSEQVISDLKGTGYTFKARTPPDSPTSDRHSLSSSMNSLVSAPESDGASQRSASPSNRLQALKSSNNNGLLSVASQDSGFTSQDALFARPHAAPQNNRNSSNKQRSHGSLEEEKSDSMSVYSSISQGSRGSNDYDSNSVHSGSTHSVPSAIQNQLRHQPSLDRAHTISGARPHGRPHLGTDTYDGPTGNRSSEFGNMGPPPRPQRMSSYESTSSSTSSQSVRRSSTTSSRSSMPPRTRAKPKPVAMPSVPFMDTEPIYMNTQELAAKIAARKKQEEEEELKLTTQSAEPTDAIKGKPPTTKVEEIRAQNDALADAIKELEASTAALNDCLDEPSNRQSIVSSSGYGTTTSNSSASEEVQLITHETVDSYHTNAMNMQNTSVTNRISEETIDQPKSHPANNVKQRANNNIQQSTEKLIPPPLQLQQSAKDDRHANEIKRQSEGVEVTNWAGRAVMRRHAGQAKPPPPVRRSSSITASMNGAPDRTSSQRVSKPPVLSPKPKLSSSSESRGVSGARASSIASNESFPSPPPKVHDDEDPYAVPMPCHPVETSPLPPPPPEFGTDIGSSEPDNNFMPFNISDLPPPIPDSPAPAYLTSQLSPNPAHSAMNNVAHQVCSDPQINSLPPPHSALQSGSKHLTAPPQTNSALNPAPWNQGVKSPKSNSRGEAPPPTLAKKGKKLNSNFLAQLNSTLGGTEKGNVGLPPPNTNRSAPAALEHLKTSKSKDAPSRNNLLSQIHGGVRLKKAVNVCDRSAPSI